MNKIFSITSDECDQIDKEYEIAEIVVALRKAMSEVGDIKISEAISELLCKTRFSVRAETYLNFYEQTV